ncbi:unnamed protein product [Closterium sp. NIES-53]
MSLVVATSVGPGSRSAEEIEFLRHSENLLKVGDAAELDFLSDVVLRAADVAVDALIFVHVAHLLTQR